MEENTDLFEIIGTNRQHIKNMSKQKDKKEIENFLKEKAKERIRILENQKNINRLKKQDEAIKEKVEREIDIEIAKVKSACITLLNEDFRNQYGGILEDDNGEKNEREKSAYIRLGVSENQCKTKGEKWTNERLKNNRQILIEELKAKIQDRQKLNEKIKEVEEAYALIKDESSRREYDKILKQLEIKKQGDRREKYLEEKYSFRKLYTEKISTNKCNLSYVKVKEGTYQFYRRNGERVLITQTAKIGYIGDNNIRTPLYQYEITRIVNNEIKNDVIYGVLVIQYLEIDKETKEPCVNPEYYDLVLNEVLSEESIEGCCKFNEGYIGEIIGDNRREFKNPDAYVAAVKVANKLKKSQKKEVEEEGRE